MKHFKPVKSLLAVLLVCYGFCIVTNIGLNIVMAADKTLPVYVNEEPSGYNAVCVDGKWYMKLRDICDIYCIEMNYNDNTQTITVYDKPQPTVLSLSANNVVEQEKMFVKNDYVYVPLDSVLTFNAEHMQQGHLDIERTFNFKNGSWVYSSYGALEQPLASVDSYQQKDDLAYAIFFTTGGDTASGRGKVWEFKPNGRCRAVAEYWLQITSFAVDDDWVFIVGRDTWNASSVWKFSLADGTETQLGQADYNYGDNLSRTMNNVLANNNITPLPHTGIIVREDGVYTVGYSQYGYFENNIIDKDVFTDTYGYYRLSKDGGTHEKVADWPK